MLELINAERAKAGVPPLAFDSELNDAAEDHSEWMIQTDTFSHTGVGGSSPTTRIRNSGYDLTGSWATGENIAYATLRAPSGTQDEVELLHQNLMNSSGHRANILNGNFREVGLGFETGEYRGRDTAFVTENFAKSGSDVFLTGVVFDDQDGDKFYDPGEGMDEVTVTAVRSDGRTFQTTVYDSGGYSLALPAGTYQVTFSGGGIAETTKQVSIGSQNVKLDLVDPALGSSAPPAPQPEPEPQPQPEPEPQPQPDPDETAGGDTGGDTGGSTGGPTGGSTGGNTGGSWGGFRFRWSSSNNNNTTTNNNDNDGGNTFGGFRWSFSTRSRTLSENESGDDTDAQTPDSTNDSFNFGDAINANNPGSLVGGNEPSGNRIFSFGHSDGDLPSWFNLAESHAPLGDDVSADAIMGRVLANLTSHLPSDH
ncbi:CAP domain-containing protein [Stappia albiluteola]|uniref:CAP domain-containing protein n=1 Tax=Stappia albiluteola TaxID=2758565 RepID=UPI001F43187F|nr:CAP domain-containing protein [Stappia albiluteola]